MEFPLGVFGIALATVILAESIRAARQGFTRYTLHELMDWALRWVCYDRHTGDGCAGGDFTPFARDHLSIR